MATTKKKGKSKKDKKRLKRLERKREKLEKKRRKLEKRLKKERAKTVAGTARATERKRVIRKKPKTAPASMRSKGTTPKSRPKRAAKKLPHAATPKAKPATSVATPGKKKRVRPAATAPSAPDWDAPVPRRSPQVQQR